MLVYFHIKYSLCELCISVILINHIVPKTDEIIFRIGCMFVRAAGYASGMREVVRAASLNPDAYPDALHLMADHHQPRHYTPCEVITQV